MSCCMSIRLKDSQSYFGIIRTCKWMKTKTVLKNEKRNTEMKKKIIIITIKKKIDRPINSNDDFYLFIYLFIFFFFFFQNILGI